jgi:hypothetical protein
MLRAAGVLRAVKQGKQVYYAIQYQYLAETLRGIADALEACDPALAGETSEGCESQESDG